MHDGPGLTWRRVARRRIASGHRSAYGNKKRAAPEAAARFLSNVKRCSDSFDLNGLGTFVPSLDFKFHPVTLGERAKALRDDLGVVGKDILAPVFGCNEAKAFVIVKPLDCASGH